MSSPADALLLSLSQYHLLDANQTTAIRGWADERGADAATALKELMARGWLTQFQVREIAKGKTRELLFGSHLLLDILGEGGMGRVYKARHIRLRRDEALKVIRRDKLSNLNVVSRFQQEIRAAARVQHQNVVMAFDAEDEGDNLFLSMEYVEGTDLTKLVRQNGPMPLPHACDAVRQAAVGLQYIHELGLVHRDIKPSNLLYTPRGQVKLLDLGLALLNQAAVPGGENANRVTQEGFVLGSPDFLAPEQAQNPAGVDIRADIYGLGATLFYLLTARVPFDGQTPTEKLMKHITEPPPNLLAFRPDAPPQLAAIIQWMMAKRPEDRPQTPAQVAAALAPFGLPQSASFPMPLAPRPVPAAPVAPFAQPYTPPTGIHSPLQPPPPPPPNAFEDLDADDSREEPRSRSRSRRDEDDRPRRRGETRVKEPKKRSSLPLILIGLGVVFTVCLGVCAGVLAFGYNALENSKPFDPEYTTQVGSIKLVKVEPGKFEMGSTDAETGHLPDEGPVREVTLSKPFYIGVSEITRQQYQDVTKKSPGTPPGRINEKILPRFPATVSWNDANEFVRLLNANEKGLRSGWEFRLPTEAEWEYCARAGRKAGPFGGKSRLTQYRDGIFKLGEDDPYGETNPAVAGKYPFDDKPSGALPAAGDADYDYRREPNEWGLYDMTGNVWELCRDRYGNYPDERTATDPMGSPTGTARVARGGAFDTTATQCRAAARRVIDDPSKAAKDVGFRIVYAPKIDR